MDNVIDITAKITGIKYTPLLCKKLDSFSINELSETLSKEATFILDIDDKNQIALSWWVSAKRTRSYPYARIYDSLGFSGKKVTIIPIVKDEGKEGDRDFLQWDTVSLMSLLGVYVIIGYYSDAVQSSRYENKITEQRFDIEFIKSEITKLLSYQSDALHWNLSQIDKIGEIGQKALKAYESISKKLKIEMHSKKSAEERIKQLMKGKETFMKLSRELAEKAQKRESVTIQPKERLTGEKATITIKNYLGGYYYFTADEIEINENNIYLIEGKHTETSDLPSLSDIKDGLLKMILFTNLEEIKVDSKNYSKIPILKLTTNNRFRLEKLNESTKNVISLLKREMQTNGFKVMINNNFLE
jgi:hypothetical protein